MTNRVVFLSLLVVLLFQLLTGCKNQNKNNSTAEKELELQKKELELKEKELELREKEISQKHDNSTPQSEDMIEGEDAMIDYYIINVAAVKTEQQANSKVKELEKNGYEAGYLWIPDYASLSGAKLYSVYVGPFDTQYECEVATEAYRKIHPEAYGLLVSQEHKRVQINGVGKVTITKN
ncbi:MAG: SPOR domain-containing protein [Bacteroidota bacterium]|jgi:cell division septation protein DedD